MTTRAPYEPHEHRVDLRQMQEILGGSLIWVALAFLAIAVAAFNMVRIGRVSGEEVGVLLNRMNGKLAVINQPGVKIYNGITHRFYVLDKTLQTLDMTQTVGRGDRQERDDLKVKTSDGSDVFVDLKVQYRITADAADMVLCTSGEGEAYKEKWARDYVRSLARNYLGELTTEDFYDSSQRNAKVVLALHEAQKRLQPFGIGIDSLVIPTKPQFHEKYEDLIKKKKLADQEVEEEASKAMAAQQLHHTRIVEETNKKNVAVEEFSGQMEQKEIEAKAQAGKIMKEADAYYDKTTIGAEALLYEQQKKAEGTLAMKKAEAEGIEAMKEALEGEGGRNMVKLEYAKKLQSVVITGQPFLIDSRTARFQHTSSDAAAVKRK